MDLVSAVEMGGVNFSVVSRAADTLMFMIGCHACETPDDITSAAIHLAVVRNLRAQGAGPLSP